MKSCVASCIAHVLLAGVALAGMALAAAGDVGAGAAEHEADEESDSAPYTVAVEHESGRVCSGALVSLRTALTSARCALGAGAGGAAAGGSELWARAAGASLAARRVMRIALVEGAGGARDAWGAAAAMRDLALLELAEALPGGRPILLATTRADCEPPLAPSTEHLACYLVRALGSGRQVRLRIEELALSAASMCWPAAGTRGAGAELALCLAGPELCQSDWGAGVVCGGKLCGVLSASRGAGGWAGSAACGAPHAAASAPRWRRFLHCAHTRGACGRDGECAQLCSERWLLDEPVSLPAPTELPAPPVPHVLLAAEAASPPKRTTVSEIVSEREELAPALNSQEYLPLEPPALTRRTQESPPPPVEPPALTRRTQESPPPPLEPPALTRRTQESPLPHVERPALTRSTLGPPPSPPAPIDTVSTSRHALEFEPNRADFTAGEYGDNAADYAEPPEAERPKEVELVLPAPTPAPISAPPALRSPSTSPPPATQRGTGAVMAQVSPKRQRQRHKVGKTSASGGVTPPLPSFLCLASVGIFVSIKPI